MCDWNPKTKTMLGKFTATRSVGMVAKSNKNPPNPPRIHSGLEIIIPYLQDLFVSARFVAKTPQEVWLSNNLKSLISQKEI